MLLILLGARFAGERFLALVVFIAGGLLLRYAYRKGHALKRYEFEHMTTGGVIQFPDYDDAERHRRDLAFTKMTGALGLMLAGFGGLWVLIAL